MNREKAEKKMHLVSILIKIVLIALFLFIVVILIDLI